MAEFVGATLLAAVAWLIIRSAVISAIQSAMPRPGDWYEADDKGKWTRRRAHDTPRYPSADELDALTQKR